MSLDLSFDVVLDVLHHFVTIGLIDDIVKEMLEEFVIHLCFFSLHLHLVRSQFEWIIDKTKSTLLALLLLDYFAHGEVLGRITVKLFPRLCLLLEMGNPWFGSCRAYHLCSLESFSLLI